MWTKFGKFTDFSYYNHSNLSLNITIFILTIWTIPNV